MTRKLSSPILTAVLLGAGVLYLVVGKAADQSMGRLPGWVLDQHVMASLAALLLLQCLFAVLYRVVRLVKGTPVEITKKGKRLKEVYHGTRAKALEALEGLGLSKPLDSAGVLAASGGVKRALALEVLMYGGVLFALFFGFTNYFFNLKGYSMISTAGEPALLNSIMFEVKKGRLASTKPLEFTVKALELVPAIGNSPSSIKLFIDAKGKINKETYTFRIGEKLKVGNMYLSYHGDSYLVFIRTVKGRHDYGSLPFAVTKDKEGPYYKGTMNIALSNASGVAYFDPKEQRFMVKVHRDGKLEYDGSFLYPGGKTIDGFRVQVGALGHFGRLEVWSHTYLYPMFFGLACFALFVVLRLLLRPRVAFVWTEEEETFFYTKNKALREALTRHSEL